MQVIISHNEEFVTALCMFCCPHCYVSAADFLLPSIGPEIWNVEAGRVTHKGKVAVVEDAFDNPKSARGSGANTPARSRLQTPAASVTGTPAGSGAEEPANGAVPPVRKKKKMTRNQIKAQEERRRVRKLNWLTFGGPKPEDTDSD
jgi:elongation factor 3